MATKEKGKKEKGTRRMPKPLKITLLSLLGLVLAILIATIAVWSIGSDYDLKYIDGLAAIGDNGLEYAVDEDTGYYRFVKADDADFKVMRLSDTHLGCGILSKENDKAAIDTIYALVERSKPDLIIVTGDMIFPLPYVSGTNNNYHQMKVFIEFMEQLEIPWTVTFGNHDTEVYSFADRKDLSDYITAYDTRFCIYQAGPESISGYGNTMIEVENSDGTINMVYCVLDSNAYVDGSVFYEYDSIHADQAEWYKEQIATLANIYTDGDTTKLPSIALWHIACKEYQTAYDLHLEGSDEVEWLGIGENEELEEYVSEPAYPDTDVIFDAISEAGSTRFVFVGHDHYNSFGAKYEDVYLCYGLAIDYLGYTVWDPDFSNKTDFRGATLISTDDLSNVTVYQDRYVGRDSTLRVDALWSE